jgi:hypothetical protein
MQFCSWQPPMYTFYDNGRVHKLFADFYTAGKIASVLYHGTVFGGWRSRSLDIYFTKVYGGAICSITSLKKAVRNS